MYIPISHQHAMICFSFVNQGCWFIVICDL